jgi:integrase
LWGYFSNGGNIVQKLSVKELEVLTDDDVGTTLRDGDGLIGKVKSTRKGISIAFYYRFRWQDKWKDFSCGSWPKNNLTYIRKNRNNARQKVEEGINPIDEKKAVRIRQQADNEKTILEDQLKRAENLTIQDLYDIWIVDGVARQDKNAELKRRFGKDVLPNIGALPIKSITDSTIRNLLRKISERDVTRYVISLHADLNQMLAWGEKRKPWRKLMEDGNPAVLVEVNKLINPLYKEERDRVLSESELKELKQIFISMEQAYASLPAGKKYTGRRPFERKSQHALWICLSTLCRIGEILRAEWKHIDFEKRIWLVPAPNSKNKEKLEIYLSDFALTQFKALQKISGHCNFVFPAKRDESKHIDVKSISKSVGDRQVQFKNRKTLSKRNNDNSLVLADGKNGDWTPHDLRRTGATMMQKLGVSLEVIDRCQNHVIHGSKVRRAYLHYDYQNEMRDAWATLATELEQILSNN